MSCALDKLVTLNDKNIHLENALNYLSTAVFLMDEYYHTWHSIIWIRSKQKTKRLVREKLNRLAFDAYTAFQKATEHLNLYVDTQSEKELRDEFVEPPPPWWNEMMRNLQVAESCFFYEHRREISSKQLQLEL